MRRALLVVALTIAALAGDAAAQYCEQWWFSHHPVGANDDCGCGGVGKGTNIWKTTYAACGDPNPQVDSSFYNCLCDGTPALTEYYDGRCQGCGNCELPACQSSFEPQPESCDGTEPVPGPEPVDPGCGDDEHECQGRDQDPFPVRYSTGRVELQPVIAYEAPGTPDGFFFGVRLDYGSGNETIQAWNTSGSGTSYPVTSPSDHVQFVGRGWIDNVSDRLIIQAHQHAPGTVTWRRGLSIVTFDQVAAGQYKSRGGEYVLVDQNTPGPPPTSSPRWVVTRRSGHVRQEMWGFEEIAFSTPAGNNGRLGRLVRHALITAPGNLTGYYGINVTWNALGYVDKVVDTWGRELRYTHASIGGQFMRLASVSLAKSASDTSPVQVASFGYRPGNSNVLERVNRVGTDAYTRFLYWSPPPTCANCSALITDVVRAQVAGVTPANSAAVGTNEYVSESHQYETATNGARPRAIRSSGPGRSYFYRYFATYTEQFDLNQPGAACVAGACAASGHACLPATETGGNVCYPTAIVDFTPPTRQVNALTQMSSGGSSSGHTYSEAPHNLGAPRRDTDAAGTRTTYGFNTMGNLRCIVYDDNDDEAFATPGSPDTSACAGPAGARIARIDYTATTITKTLPSDLAGGTFTIVETIDTAGRPTQQTWNGSTRDIAGGALAQTRTTSTTYDSFGRVTQTDGPLNNATVGNDVVDTTYHTSSGASDYNLGQVATVTRWAGTTHPTGSMIPLVTTYSDYDRWGVAQKVTQPSGEYTTYVPSADRLTWTITPKSAANVALGTTIVQLNPDGSVRSVTDGDGVCTTYQYTTSVANQIVRAPTGIKRGSACGVLPIDLGTGETEERTYASGEAQRLATITRRMAGVVQFSYAGFTYDNARRLAAATSNHGGAQPYTYAYDDVGLLESVTAPGGPGAGTWKGELVTDPLGRPAAQYKHLSASSKQTFQLGYTSPWTILPTTLTRGLNGTAASVSTFTYDDFGQLVASVVPEQGTSRWEYDVGGRIWKHRVGVGTAQVRTSQHTHDSLGRLTRVDHDLENPVNCASAPAGTRIQDEEYRYDNCQAGDIPTGFSCSNALGRKTVDRTIVQCASGGATVQRGRWYGYDAWGRVQKVAYATVSGGVFGLPATMEYRYTSGSRLQRQESPLNPVFHSQYTYTNGLVTRLDGNCSLGGCGGGSGLQPKIADNFTYRAFGPLTGLDTSVSYSSTNVRLRLSHDDEDNLTGLTWGAYNTTSGALSTAFLNQSLSYTPAGLLSQRNDAADKTVSRFYGYDPAMRLACEARGTTTTYPNAADCATADPQLAALHTYHDGASASAPQDVRASQFIKRSDYTSPQAEVPSYSGGSGRATVVTTGSATLVLGTDAIGRRTFDYDSYDATRSRRDYTYLPNGQLGSISGRTPANLPYSVAVAYDTGGRPLTMTSGSTTVEFFYDDSDRLLAAQSAAPTTSPAGMKYVRWHFHYLGETPIAVTREIQLSPTGGTTTTTAKRFWFLMDERGFIHQMMDNAGVVVWKGQLDASGWQAIAVQAADVWMPFALAGQIVLPETAAYASGAGGTTHTRAPLALNQWRVYDPLMGSFLQPDGMDAVARQDPEQYAYGRSRPVVSTDRSGMTTGGTRARECSPDEMSKIYQLVSMAITELSSCISGQCRYGGPTMTRWMRVMTTSRYRCPDEGVFFAESGSIFEVFPPDAPNGNANRMFRDQGDDFVHGFAEQEPGGIWTITLSPYERTDLVTDRCKARTIAHEALHGVLNMNTYQNALGFLPFVSKLTITDTNAGGPIDLDDDEEFVREETRRCFSCRN